jgi:hypothetical protein
MGKEQISEMLICFLVAGFFLLFFFQGMSFIEEINDSGYLDPMLKGALWRGQHELLWSHVSSGA